ncbi:MULTISPECIES: hypothetical protein [unclassified Leeuwenhoekiella]|uniref:hypothetical protein n=1 Tax=unclassified Leeuwenhoekiella TaxID=2615029 RepID=UPI000C6110DE|nr:MULTISPECIES: hypothetical protein [unclassified Leeuwenhoekiella]MAW97019.1 hypothetical protein [Leeuwenhoekiella sp.]MBA80700.1 hypothetical protein [Leeuwenhoekiella sp.]|tara:strand:- start:26238 stop:28958 length:2721 start_codon:yes stop_codon:yes gene_type:complete
MIKFLQQYWCLVVLWIGVLGCFEPVHAQLNQLQYAEKIYLQTDADVYTSGNQIWFKAIVLLGPNHILSKSSGVLHVELIGPDREEVVSQLIKLQDGIGAGSITLDPELAEGTYFLRAYTRWNQNFESDFIFQKTIPIFSPQGQVSRATRPLQITQKNTNDDKSLTVRLDPKSVDSLHRGKLDVFINLDGKHDTLAVRQKEGDFYVLEYPLETDSDVLSISYRTDSGKKQYQTIALDTSKIDLQFFPEGGDLIAGIPALVGFKAVGYDGLGRQVSGTITDQNGTELTTFTSNVLGMGSFRLNSKSDTLNYFAELQRQDGSIRKIPLPKVQASGSTLSIRNMGAGLQVQVLSNQIPNDTIRLQLSSRGKTYYNLREPLNKGLLSAIFPGAKLPFGILEISLFDNQNVQLARRLYFNDFGMAQLKLVANQDQEVYAPREELHLQLEVTDTAGNPRAAHASVLVLDEKQLGGQAENRTNILSYFLLQSELRGHIEQPGYYFEGDRIRTADIDKLLLTQGWARYKYDHTVTSRTFLPEPVLMLSGTVSAAFNKNKRRDDIKLTLMSFGDDILFQEQHSDSLGRFNFNLDNLSGGYQNMVLQTTSEKGKNKDYNLNLKQTKKPEIRVQQQQEFVIADTTIVEAALQKIDKQRILREAIPFGGEDIALDEVLVNSYKMTPKRQEVADKYGMPDEVIDGKAIQDKEEKWSYGLYSVLLFNFPDKIRIVRKAGVLRAEVSLSDTTLVLVDGKPVLGYNYDLIPNLPVSEVESFEIIEMAKNFSSLYLEAYPNASPLEAPPWGHVIAIYTYGGNGLFAAERPKGILKERVQVFSEPEAFYTPKYETQQDLNRSEPDLRSTLYWEPDLQIDENGKAAVEFYNPDNTGTMLLYIEAVSPQGELGYSLKRYQILEEEDP